MMICKYPKEVRPPRLNQLRALGYKTFETTDFDLNLIGVRSRNRTPGKFDDTFYCIYLDRGEWIEERFICTVDPSAEQHLDPTNPRGVAILKPGQYRGVYKLDMHRGKYLALCQRNGEVTVYRDNTHDRRSDHIREESGMFGINIHRAHESLIKTSTKWYSSGCTVIQHPADFARLMALCQMQVDLLGYESFTYTLLEDY